MVWVLIHMVEVSAWTFPSPRDAVALVLIRTVADTCGLVQCLKCILGCADRCALSQAVWFISVSSKSQPGLSSRLKANLGYLCCLTMLKVRGGCMKGLHLHLYNILVQLQIQHCSFLVQSSCILPCAWIPWMGKAFSKNWCCVVFAQPPIEAQGDGIDFHQEQKALDTFVDGLEHSDSSSSLRWLCVLHVRFTMNFLEYSTSVTFCVHRVWRVLSFAFVL